MSVPLNIYHSLLLLTRPGVFFLSFQMVSLLHFGLRRREVVVGARF